MTEQPRGQQASLTTGICFGQGTTGSQHRCDTSRWAGEKCIGVEESDSWAHVVGNPSGLLPGWSGVFHFVRPWEGADQAAGLATHRQPDVIIQDVVDTGPAS